jgi:N,N'-diacetyllegionaminate synthase
VKTLVIAEVGVNHNGDLELAKCLVASAKFAGADVVKFQSFKASQLVTTSAQTAPYQKRSVGEGETQLAMLRKLELTREEHKVLAIECEKQGIEFCSTAFDADSFDMLIDLGLKRVKIPSGEINNLPLLRYMTRLGLPVILSTGMATSSSVQGQPESWLLFCSAQPNIPRL